MTGPGNGGHRGDGADETPGGLLSLRENGAAEWVSERVAAVAPVAVQVGEGCSVDVDPAFPAYALSWRAPAGSDGGPLARAFGESAPIEALAELRAGAGVRILPAPNLIGAWVRYAEVESVARWSMRPLHLGALAADRAVAAHAVGFDGDAGAWFARAADALPELAERGFDGSLSAAATDLVRIAIRTAGRSGAGAEYLYLATDLDDHHVLADDTVAEALSRWHRVEAVSDTWTLGGDRDTERIAGFVDIRLVPPRILAWSGADHPELRVEYTAEGESWHVTTDLAPDVDARCREARRLLAYAARRMDGALVATAPARLRDRALVATLPTDGYRAEDLIFGLFDADIDVYDLRTDPLGRCLAEVDRLMVEAWGRHRAATAALVSVPPDASETVLRTAQSEHRARLRIIRSMIGGARVRLEQELARTDPAGPGNDAAAILLAARLSALARYLTVLRDGGAVEPILAELIPPDEP